MWNCYRNAIKESSSSHFNRIPLNAMPIGTPSEMQRFTMPMRSVRSSLVVTSAT